MVDIVNGILGAYYANFNERLVGEGVQNARGHLHCHLFALIFQTHIFRRMFLQRFFRQLPELREQVSGYPVFVRHITDRAL